MDRKQKGKWKIPTQHTKTLRATKPKGISLYKRGNLMANFCITRLGTVGEIYVYTITGVQTVVLQALVWILRHGQNDAAHGSMG